MEAQHQLGHVVRYYWRMADENGVDAAMGYTLEMFEGLPEAAIEAAIAETRIDGSRLYA